MVSDQEGSHDVVERIQRIEVGLLPDPVLKNREPEPQPLIDRMGILKTPGVSIAVIDRYQIDWARGYGVLAIGRPERVGVETPFQAASISKPVAAMAALRLVEEGHLALDEDVNRYLASWKIPANGAWQPRVTLRHLLSHTGGLTVHGFPGYPRDDPLPTLRQVLDGEKPANTPAIRVDIVPGLHPRYSGGGYCVLQQLLVDVTGQSVPDLMRQLVLDPLGMTQSSYEQPLPPARWRATPTGYLVGGEPVQGQWHVYPEMAAAGLWTTPSDLARFAIEIQRGQAGRSTTVLSPTMTREMLAPQADPRQGLGINMKGAGRSLRFWHDGWNEGFNGDLVAYPELGRGAVVLINSNHGYRWGLVGEILRAIAYEYGWPEYLPQNRRVAPINSHIHSTYVGAYEPQQGVKWVVSDVDQTLFLQLNDQAPIQLYPKSDTMFFAQEVNIEVTFTKTEDGMVTGVRLQQDGQQVDARKRV